MALVINQTYTAILDFPGMLPNVAVRVAHEQYSGDKKAGKLRETKDHFMIGEWLSPKNGWY